MPNFLPGKLPIDLRLLLLASLLLGAAASAQDRWVVDLPALRASLPSPEALSTLDDAYRVALTVGGRTVVADTHLFGGPVVVVPYHNGDHVRDAAGDTVERGDVAVARLFPPGEIGLAVKHHRPTRRVVTIPFRSVFGLREDLKLQDTHVLMVIGVIREGRPGAVTLSSPQSYESGRFGTASYPMIFFRLRYPDYLDAEQVRAFRDNIRTMMVGFSALAHLPCNYSAGDPLAARSVAAVGEQTAMMVRALGGDVVARSFFSRDENLLYCAELAHLATSAGLLTPLNAATFGPLVGEQAWQAFREQVERHQRGEASNFSAFNENSYVPLVELALAPADLRSAASYAPPERRAVEETRLAFAPMSFPDMVDVFVREHLSRQTLGAEAPALQVELLRSIGPGLESLLGLDRLAADDPRRPRADDLWQRILRLIGDDALDYETLRRRLAPLLDETRALCNELQPGTADIVPPSLFHAVAQGLWGGGLLGLEYAGHGVHFSFVRLAPAAEPTTVDAASTTPSR